MIGQYKGISMTLAPGMKVKITQDIVQAKKTDLKTFNCGLHEIMHKHFGKIVTIYTVEKDHFTIKEDCCFKWNPYWVRQIMVPKPDNNPSTIRDKMTNNLFHRSINRLNSRYSDLN